MEALGGWANLVWLNTCLGSEGGRQLWDNPDMPDMHQPYLPKSKTWQLAESREVGMKGIQACATRNISLPS